MSLPTVKALSPNDPGIIGKSEGGLSRREQDQIFQASLQKAIMAGLEHCSTTLSTEPGTRHPVPNYTRDDYET
jgi:hypothetical protein